MPILGKETLVEVHGGRGERRRVDFSEAGLGDEKD